jgi:hypothetical protein
VSRLAAAAAALLLGTSASGCAAGEETTVTETVTETTTVTETRTETVAAGLPEPVERTRRAVQEAAAAGDHEALEQLLGDDFSYTFGAPVEGGPTAYWRNLEQTTDERPLAILAELLGLPPTLQRGVYVWPFAFDRQANELTDHERDLLASVGGADLSDDFADGGGYLGWRAGIEADGDWIFFIAGD